MLCQWVTNTRDVGHGQEKRRSEAVATVESALRRWSPPEQQHITPHTHTHTHTRTHTAPHFTHSTSLPTHQPRATAINRTVPQGATAPPMAQRPRTAIPAVAPFRAGQPIVAVWPAVSAQSRGELDKPFAIAPTPRPHSAALEPERDQLGGRERRTGRNRTPPRCPLRSPGSVTLGADAYLGVP